MSELTEEQLKVMEEWFIGPNLTGTRGRSLIAEVRRLQAAEEAAFRAGFRYGDGDGSCDCTQDEAWIEYQEVKPVIDELERKRSRES